jgi:CheY-like chemotaxis protein
MRARDRPEQLPVSGFLPPSPLRESKDHELGSVLSVKTGNLRLGAKSNSTLVCRMEIHPTILLVEDDEDDVILIARSIQKARLLNPLQIVRDGEEAIDYLAGEGVFADRTKYPLPFLVLLDLHMPKQNGFNVLSWMRRRPDLRRLKVAVLTSSSDEHDYAQAMKLGANSYFRKPGSLEEFVHLMLRIQGHWVLLDNPEAADTPETTACLR